MRKLIFTAITLLIFSTSALSGDYCKSIEYAEIKDMDKTELLDAFKQDATKFAMGREGEKCRQNIKAYQRQLKKRFKYTDEKLAMMYLEYQKTAWENEAKRSSQQ